MIVDDQPSDPLLVDTDYRLMINDEEISGMRWYKLMIVVFSIILGLAACGDETKSDVRGTKACLDFIDTTLGLCDKCFNDYVQECRQSFREALDINCNQVKSVKDADFFYDVCLKKIRDTTCEQLMNGEITMDSRCNGQLLL